jgi:Holliday junction resolvase RusA-like endonuclease
MFRPSEEELEGLLQRGKVTQAADSAKVFGKSIAGVWIELPLPPSTNDYWRHPGFNLFDAKLVGEIVQKAMSGGVQGVLAWARKRVKGLHLVSVEGRRFKRHVWVELRRLGAIKPMTGRLRCQVELECRTVTSDIDNRLKPLFDALQGAGAYKNDSQIDHCTFWRGKLNKAGKCRIYFEEIGGG